MKHYKIIAFLTIFFASSIYANIVKDIKIIGNNNIDKEVIISIIKDYSTSISDENINFIIKKLNKIPGIQNAKILINEQNIEISIIENTKILDIKFTGNERFNKNEIFEIIDIGILDYYDDEKINKFIF